MNAEYMKTPRLFFAVTVFLSALTRAAAGTEMESRAGQMQPGEWRELVTMNIGATLRASGASGFIFGYTDDIQWDPASRQLLFVGGDHNSLMRFVTYSETSNTWQIPLQPLWLLGGTNHGYDHMAINPTAGLFYVREGYHGDTLQRFNIASGVWSRLPENGLRESSQCCGGIDYFPELDGVVWAQGGETSSDGSVFLFKESTQKWSRLGRDLSMGPYHNFTEYNPVHKVMLFGGGNNSSQIYKLDGAGKITRLQDAPLELAIQATVITVDPGSGEYLVFAGGNVFYTYDVSADSWRRQSGSTPIFSEAVHGIVATPISNYGVNLFVTARTSPFKVYLYKHSKGGGSPVPDRSPPTTPGGVQATVVSPAQIDLSWSASNDNVGVAGYKIYRNSLLAATTTETGYHDVGLETGKSYTYQVSAYDASGNESPPSPQVTAITSNPPPAPPRNLSVR